MERMFVTLEVSQLETFSLNVAKLRNRLPMSVIDETVQPEIGPYVLRAVARSLFHIWTAVFREAVVTKDGGGGGNGGAGGGGRTNVAAAYCQQMLVRPDSAAVST